MILLQCGQETTPVSAVASAPRVYQEDVGSAVYNTFPVQQVVAVKHVHAWERTFTTCFVV